ncbi:uncharacterized protein METZ01_LOCUS384197, partial [marine metagenome]
MMRLCKLSILWIFASSNLAGSAPELVAEFQGTGNRTT